jgi:hypothetical protein
VFDAEHPSVVAEINTTEVYDMIVSHLSIVSASYPRARNVILPKSIHPDIGTRFRMTRARAG